MPPITQHRNRTVRVDQFSIIENALAKTYLTADLASGVSALTVKDIGKFSTGKYVWIDPFGPNSEIIAVHASTSPSGSTITLAANTAYAHTTSEEVYYIEFNQVEISHADTLAGAKDVLSTEALVAREKELTYLDTTETAGFYFARFKDSVASSFGSYSGGVAYGGWDSSTVGYMIDVALRDLSLEFSHKVTLRDCIRWINKGMREIKGKIRKWAEHYVYDFITDQAQRGDNTFTLPSNIYDSETIRSIEAARIGSDRQLIVLAPESFDSQMEGVNKTQVRTEASASDTTLEVDNSYDFEDSGTLVVYISGTKYEITYTGVTRDDSSGGTAVFSGIPASGDGSISVTIPVDTNVWQNEEEGRPVFMTIRNGAGEFWPLVSDEYDNANVYLDYNIAATEVDSEDDVIDYQRYDMLESYLKWRMWCKAENDGKLDKANGEYTDYKESLNDAIRTMPVTKTKTAPNINRMNRGRRSRIRKPDIEPTYYT